MAERGNTPQHSVAAAAVREEGAPGRLEAVRRFVNTRDVEDGIEELGTPAAARSWLREHGLPDVPAADAKQLERLTALREALRQLLLANNGQAHDQRALERLRAEAAGVPLQVRFDAEGQSALVPAGAGIDAVVAELLGIVHEAMANGTWARLKACRSETCEWAFYDRSRNRSGTWCSMAVCGNRAKARSHRRRHRARESARESGSEGN
ncbi:MAG: CGNR zinc finger domain-containing protein [Solirubrobacterales bacterium]